MKARTRRHVHERGMSLIEIMITLTIIAMVSAGVAVFAIGQWNKAKLKQAGTDGQSLRSAVELYWTTENSSVCPTYDDLILAQMVDEGRSETDPWGKAYVIECEDSRVSVVSAGPDGQLETSDDIVLPKRRKSPVED